MELLGLSVQMGSVEKHILSFSGAGECLRVEEGGGVALQEKWRG